MNTKTTSGTDNNVLTSFQPMPKRFMIWDRLKKEWLNANSPTEYWGIYCNRFNRTWILENDARFIIVQSTNLFDKDGNEIFEGGIIEYDEGSSVLGVVVNVDGRLELKDKNGNLMFLKGAPHQKLVGHILSNPELVSHILSNPELVEVKC